MVDFKKKLKKGDFDKKINPLEIYDTLDRKSITGPLRPVQKHILGNWFTDRYDDKDIILKLHTGEGKTLIGLLMLQSKLNNDKGPCLYLCPNKYLVQQVCAEAKKFGIPFCTISDGPDRHMPNEFLEGKKVLITNIQKLFNGYSIFGLDTNSIPTGSVVLDDSHACIDSIRNSFSIKINHENELYQSIKSLFEEELRNQGEGSYLDIDNGDYNTILPIPYWSWIEKKSEVIQLLSSHSGDDEIKFAWPVIKNTIPSCQVIISGHEIEIVPYYIPVRSFGSFSKAKQRILMSATTQDDAFFIKGLGFSTEAVQNPLTFSDQKWSGEKMVLIPSLIDENLDRELILEKLAKPLKKNYGVVSLVSSYKKTELYKHWGAKIAQGDIFEIINDLKKGEFTSTVVIVNRYDGIDLPDESCRILIVDSMPYFNSLSDRYEEQCRSTSDLINVKIAQRIEQGLGRSVRGEKDYTVIIIIGADLVKYVRSVRTNKFFSPQTIKQIDIGLEIAKMAQDELSKDKDPFSVVVSLIKQSLQRDDGWKEFYKEEMDKIESKPVANEIYNILKLEKEAEEAAIKDDFETACQKIQCLIDCSALDENEKGWYLQLLARYKYFISKTDSNMLQKSAFQANSYLLKPKDGISYKKIEYINENRIKRIKDWISDCKTYDELMLNVQSILSDFTFGCDSDKFENAVFEIGKLLGFISQRPCKEIRKGPDNLWGGVDNKYFLFECKSEVDEGREEINKSEAGQMNVHCGWFDTIYGNAFVKRVLIIPTIKLSYYADFTHDVKILRKGKMRLLKDNIKSFIKEFKLYNISEISDEKIQSFLNVHKLDVSDLETEYFEEYKKR